jgi:hypothetical protein
VSFKVRYHDFWPGFNPEEFLITGLLRTQVGQELSVVTNPDTFVDLEIWSVFTFSSWKEKLIARTFAERSEEALKDYSTRALRGHRTRFSSKARKRLWYTGENLRPPVDVFDATCSFDVTDNNTRNIFLPYWMMRMDFGITTKGSEIFPRAEELMRSRKFSKANPSLCTFSSVYEPSRAAYLKALRSSNYFGEIGTFGKLYGGWVESKKETAEKYLFQLCNENDLYPNYVTEKLQEAFICGNIPIWSGLDHNKYFNKLAMIDVTGKNSEQIRQEIGNLSSDELVEIYEQPLLNYLPDLDEVTQKLGDWIIDI